MGVVYRAWQPSLSREVALKCLTRSNDPVAEARFHREIQVLGRVEHPHLVRIFSSGGLDGQQRFYQAGLAFDPGNGGQLSISRTDSHGAPDASWGTSGVQITHDVETTIDFGADTAFVVGPGTMPGQLLIGAQYTNLVDQWFEVRAFATP